MTTSILQLLLLKADIAELQSFLVAFVVGAALGAIIKYTPRLLKKIKS
ncbi:hypothetical protein [Pontibacter harenae]|nr:hypothetical protein [Pontibacter harenae]MCC9168955.1 hypothetical protein [Pontibacter harenae]